MLKTPEEQQQYDIEHPIFGTDLLRPLSVVIEDFRSQLARIRGGLTDVVRAFGYKDRIEHIEGLLTCGLIALHATAEELRKWEHNRGEPLLESQIRAKRHTLDSDRA